MEERNLPNFPLLFEQIAHFLHEVKPLSPEQEEQRKLAVEAIEVVGKTIYPPHGICNSQPRIPIR